MVKVVASHDGIKHQIEDNIKNPFDAFNEYIWNSIDANAKNIKIIIKTGQDFIKNLAIEDDGWGINHDDLNKDLFKKFNTSNKYTEKNNSLPRGKKGFGRFAFILFSTKAKWNTTYKDKKSSKKYNYDIEIEDYKLDDYVPTNIKETIESTGTKVEFTFSTSNQGNLISHKVKDILKQLKNSISLEFCWILELLNIKITINDELIQYNQFMEEPIEHQETIDNETFKIKFIKWKTALKNQSSRYYLLNSKQEEVFVDTTKLNDKSDEFYHSIYVQSSFFDSFNIMKTRFEPTYKKLMKYIDSYLRKQRKPFIKIFSSNKYKQFEEKNLIPSFNKFERKIKQPIYEEVVKEIIEFAPTLVSNTNDSQRKILLELINQLLDDESSRKTLYSILEILIDEDNRDQLKELEDKLSKYGLRNLLGMIKEVEGRLETIKLIRKMHGEDKNYYSESDLQRVIEEHFWIFGEEYNMMIGAEEEDFTKLRKAYYEKVKKVAPADYKNMFVSRKQVDLFICGIINNRKNRHLVVEIKKPKETLKKKHYIQIDDYKDIIMKDPDYNSPDRHHWDFILLYRDISKEHKTFFDTEIIDNFTGLTKDKSSFRIFVKKWADLLEDVEFRLKFLKDSLESKKKKMTKS